MMLIIIILLIVICLLNNNKINKKEHYYNITPYKLHYDMFKCLDTRCLKKEVAKCYNWCDNIAEPGASENCRLDCMDDSDQQADVLKFNDYTWNRILPKFKPIALYRKKKDYV